MHASASHPLCIYPRFLGDGHVVHGRSRDGGIEARRPVSRGCPGVGTDVVKACCVGKVGGVGC
jgi:hypothetical protein